MEKIEYRFQEQFIRAVAGDEFKAFIPPDELQLFIADIKNSGQAFNHCFAE